MKKKKIVLIFLSIISLCLGIFLVGLFGLSLFKHYVPFSIQKTTSVIAVKESEIGLSSFPTYHIFVRTEADNISRHKATKNMMMNVSVGDEIEGYKIKERFYTAKDLVMDLLTSAVILVVGIILIFLGILYFAQKTTWSESMKKRARHFKMTKTKKAFVKYSIFLFIVLFFAWEHLYHFTHTHSKNYEQINAEIMEVERKPGYGRFNGPTFIFRVGHVSADGEPVFTKIKVPKKVYERYDQGDTLILHYPVKNPYYLYFPREG